MGPGRGRAHEQPAGDLRVGEPLGDQTDDLPFPICELVEATRRWRILRPAGEFLDQPSGDAGGEECIAGRIDPHGVDQLVRLGVLHQEPARSRADGLEHILIEAERGQMDEDEYRKRLRVLREG
jgi:hypothetical protein